MNVAAGTRLGRYEIRSKIGKGGMGEVYRARDTNELERTVAIKLLPAEVASDPKRMQRFVQEAKTVPNMETTYCFPATLGITRASVRIRPDARSRTPQQRARVIAPLVGVGVFTLVAVFGLHR